MHYNLDAIILLEYLIIPYCIINITLTLIRECQTDDYFTVCWCLHIWSFVSIKDKQDVLWENTKYGVIKSRNKEFLNQQVKSILLFQNCMFGFYIHERENQIVSAIIQIFQKEKCILLIILEYLM